ncbi:branched-chain amino acid ABC transporter permease [Alcaligenaceae bacterium]|nr:branched-chain amino acid ABC transporter permease [Alcaligenaceae bacterium]
MAACRYDPLPMRHGARWRTMEWAFWLLPILAWYVFPDNLFLLSHIAILALFALSLDLILGYAGIVSLGHAAFFGIGAYTAGLLATHGIGDPITGLLAAAITASLLGWISSFLLLRGSDLSRLMVTLGISLMLLELANKLTRYTGGVDGLSGIQMQAVLGIFHFDMHGRTGYIYSVVILLLLFWLARRLVHSPLGLSLRGMQQNHLRVSALGVPIKRRLILIYTIGAAYAGVAGALLTQTTQFVAVDVFSFQRSAELLLILVLGGTGSLYGALLGSIAFVMAQTLLSDINPQYWKFWLGLVLVIVVLFARGGIMGGLNRLCSVFKGSAATPVRSKGPL